MKTIEIDYHDRYIARQISLLDHPDPRVTLDALWRIASYLDLVPPGEELSEATARDLLETILEPLRQ